MYVFFLRRYIHTQYFIRELFNLVPGQVPYLVKRYRFSGNLFVGLYAKNWFQSSDLGAALLNKCYFLIELDMDNKSVILKGWEKLVSNLGNAWIKIWKFQKTTKHVNVWSCVVVKTQWINRKRTFPKAWNRLQRYIHRVLCRFVELESIKNASTAGSRTSKYVKLKN